VPLLSGCGGAGHASGSTTAAPPPSGGYLAAADLERQLGNAFRKGLYRLAVMSQKTEDAMDLGQRLPTGLLRAVSCDAQGPPPSGGGPWTWMCKISWRSVEGRSEHTTYAVKLRRGLCFAAGATPSRGARYDATIRTYSADPLDALGSVRRGC
jgi:hypothetical protein